MFKRKQAWNYSSSTFIALSMCTSFIILWANCFYPKVISIRDIFKLNWISLKLSFVNQCFKNHQNLGDIYICILLEAVLVLGWPIMDKRQITYCYQLFIQDLSMSSSNSLFLCLVVKLSNFTDKTSFFPGIFFEFRSLR